MGRLVSCVDEKGSSLHDVISESILLQMALQISTASLSCSLIRESLHHTNSVSFLKINRVYQKKRGQNLVLERLGFDLCNWLSVLFKLFNLPESQFSYI